jgi:hypothetical protein
MRTSSGLVLVITAVMGMSCSAAPKDDFNNFCKRLKEASDAWTKLPAAKRPPSGHLKIPGFAAQVVLQEDHPSSFGRRWLEAITTTNPRDSAWLVEEAAKDAHVKLDCPALRLTVASVPRASKGCLPTSVLNLINASGALSFWRPGWIGGPLP